MEKPLYKIVQCNLCDKEMTITHLARHMKEIHNTKRIKCYICPKSFKRKEKAINHLRNIHDVKMQDIKRSLLKEVDVPLPKNNKIKPREYKRKMVKLRDGENFDGVLNSNQIHSEYIKDKILHDNTHDRRKYLNMTDLEINLLRRENKSSQKNYSRSKSSTALNSNSLSPTNNSSMLSGSELSPTSNGKRRTRKRVSARLSNDKVKREYREDDDDDESEEESEEEDGEESDEIDDEDDDDEDTTVEPVLESVQVVKPKRGRPRKHPVLLSGKSSLKSSKRDSNISDKSKTFSESSMENDESEDIESEELQQDSDIEIDSNSESSFKVTRLEDSPQLPYDVYDKVRLVSFQISNEIGVSRLTLSFQFLTKQGKPLTIHLLREHEIKLFFMNTIPNEQFFERLNEIITNFELLDNICVTNGEIITTENFGFRYKTFCWTTVKDFFKNN